MKAVIFGGTGFIGLNLCQRLIHCGWSVTTFSRANLQPGTPDHTHVQGDFTDAGAVLKAVGSCDVVYHLVHTNTPAGSETDWSRDIAENLVPSIALVEACAAAGCRLVFASSGGTIYGKQALTPIPETATTIPIGAYGTSKLCIEHFLQLGHLRHGLAVTSLRVSNPFGALQRGDSGQGAIAAFLRATLKKDPIQIWGDGAVVRDYVHIDDVIEAFVLAAGISSGYNVYNVGSGVGRTLNDIVAAIEQVTGQRLARSYTAVRAIDVPVSILDISKIRRELGWQPALDFERQISLTYAAFRSGFSGPAGGLPADMRFRAPEIVKRTPK